MQGMILSGIKVLFLLTSTALIFPTTTEARDLTQTIACDTCDYSEAVAIANEYHVAPSCEASDTDIFLGQTTFVCPSTSKELIVSNPITRRSFKFTVRTEQLYDWAPAYDIIVEDTTLTEIEDNALHMFYDIDQDFRQAMAENETVAFSSETFSSNLNAPTTYSANSYSTTTNSDADCSDHASNILSDNPMFAEALEEAFTRRITAAMRLQSWSEFTSEPKVSAGLTIGLSAGISVSFENIERQYYVTQKWPNGDKLVFNVSYKGETRNVVQKGRMQRVTERFLNLDYKLESGVSKIDGVTLRRIMRGKSDLTDISISVCLANQLSEILDDIEVVGGRGGDGDLADIVGIDASNGGTLIPPKGTWVDLAGCQIVEGTGTICNSATGDCKEVSVRYIDC